MNQKVYIPEVFPLYPSNLKVDGALISHLDELPEIRAKLAELSLGWTNEAWHYGLSFLKEHQRSLATLSRYRTEIERFFLWCILVKQQSPVDLSSLDIAEYVDFLVEPYPTWIGLDIQSHLNLDEINPNWRPFVAKNRKGRSTKNKNELLASYRPSRSSLLVAAASLSSFYTYSRDTGYCTQNPIKRARKLSRHLASDSLQDEFEGKRLSDEQWTILLRATEEMANGNSKYERALFLVASMKVLHLRISELSVRPVHTPTFADFNFDGEFWWLYIKGKRNKARLVPVPDAYLPYLQRYRSYRSLAPLPQDEDEEPIIAAIQSGPKAGERGVRSIGVTSRQLSRIVQQAFDAAALYCLNTGDSENKAVFTKATTHMLRHTGASMAVEAGVPLKHVSENLGHGSSEFTDRIYVKSDKRARGASSKKHPVS